MVNGHEKRLFFYPNTNFVKRNRIQRMLIKFFLNKDDSYKRNLEAGALIYVNEAEAKSLMKEIHEEVCASHMSGEMLAKKKKS